MELDPKVRAAMAARCTVDVSEFAARLITEMAMHFNWTADDIEYVASRIGDITAYAATTAHELIQEIWTETRRSMNAEKENPGDT